MTDAVNTIEIPIRVQYCDKSKVFYVYAYGSKWSCKTEEQAARLAEEITAYQHNLFITSLKT